MANGYRLLHATSFFRLQMFKRMLSTKWISKVHNSILTIFFAAACSASMLILATFLFEKPRLLLSIPWRIQPELEVVSCDFSNYRSSFCTLKGDIRVSGNNFRVTLLSSNTSSLDGELIGKIRPYTRKFQSTMDIIEEVSIVRQKSTSHEGFLKCDVRHSVPAVVFSTGGYTGSVYHDFNDGLLPLYITSERFDGEVVFMVLELKSWWQHKYSGVLKQLSHYPILDFDNSQQVHCFPEVVVGLEIHGDLIMTPAAIRSHKSITSFRQVLENAFNSNREPVSITGRPKLVFIARQKTRVIVNLNETVVLAQRIGYEVHTLEPTFQMNMSVIYKLLHSADVVVGVHGAALTHFLFMRSNSTLIQIIPLGLDGPARSCYGEPSAKAGIRYVNYTVSPTESSLCEKYGLNHTVVLNPAKINSKGWTERKKVYMDNQNVSLSMPRLEPILRTSFKYTLQQAMKQPKVST